MFKIEIKSLENLDEVKELLKNVITTYNELKCEPVFRKFIYPKINRYKQTDSANQKIIKNIETLEERIDKQLVVMDFEFSILINYLQNNHFMALKQQKLISVDNDELIIRVDLNKLVKTCDTLEYKVLAHFKNQLVEIAILQNDILDIHFTMLNQIEELINTNDYNKNNDAVEPEPTKKYHSKNYKTVLNN